MALSNWGKLGGLVDLAASREGPAEEGQSLWRALQGTLRAIEEDYEAGYCYTGPEVDSACGGGSCLVSSPGDGTLLAVYTLTDGSQRAFSGSGRNDLWKEVPVPNEPPPPPVSTPVSELAEIECGLCDATLAECGHESAADLMGLTGEERAVLERPLRSGSDASCAGCGEVPADYFVGGDAKPLCRSCLKDPSHVGRRRKVVGISPGHAK